MDLGKAAIITAILLLLATGCNSLDAQTPTASGAPPASTSISPVSPTLANTPSAVDTPVMMTMPTDQGFPSRLHVSKIHEGSVHLTWYAYPEATEYVLEFASGVDRSDWEWQEIARIKAPSLTFVHQDAIADHRVIAYRHKVVTESGETAYSEPIDLVWGGGPGPIDPLSP